ncbi:hypothetical protein ACX0HA_06540 [Flavobacterium hauense]
MRLIFLLLLFTVNSFAQSTEKSGYVLNEKGENITQDFFLKQTRSGKYTWIAFETKDSLIARLIPREEYGEITPKQKEHLLVILKEISGTTVRENQTIIINFAYQDSIPNQRHCLDYYSSVKSYRKFFKKKEQFAQFYISQQGFHYSKEFIYEDVDDAIRKMLFLYASDCSYIIIKPDGRFYRQVSEHHQDKIPSIAQEDW